MIVNKIEVQFIDGTELIIEDATDWGFNKDGGIYYISKNGYKIFINPTQVKYIGREFDINNKSR